MDLYIYNQLKYLGQYLRPYRYILVLSLALSIISTTLGMIQPYFAKLLIDKVFISGNPDILIPLLTALILLLIISYIIRILNNRIYTRYSAGLLFKMREDLFKHLHRVPLNFFSKWKSGDIYSRIASDMADIQGLVTETLPNYMFDLFTCFITTIILLWLNWKMVVMSYCFLPLALLAIHWIRPKIIALSRNMTEGNADISHFLFESLGSTRLIRAFDAEGLESEKLEQKQSKILEYLLRYQMLGAWSGLVPTVFIIINSIIIFGYGGFLVLEGAMTLGSLMAFSIYQGRVLSPLQGPMNGFLEVQKAKISLSRVKEILEIQPDCLEYGDTIIRDEELEGEVVFDRVAFAYEKEEPVLQSLSFRIPAGKTTALIGPSGSGKTTVCHLAMRLFDPDSGSVSLDGIDLKTLRKDWLRKQITLISQDTVLFHTSILENIRFSNPAAGESEVVEAAKAACIHDFIQSLPKGYHTEVGDRGVRLSGGEKQRVSIARSILIKPKILIMDEATAYLDTNTEKELKDTMQTLFTGKTIVVISHRMSTVQDADKIVVMGENGIRYDGPSSEFFQKENDDMYRQFQFRDRLEV